MTKCNWAFVTGVLIGILIMAMVGCASVPVQVPVSPIVVAPVATPVPVVPVTVTHIPTFIGYWLDASQRTLNHTNVVTVPFWTDDASRMASVALMDQAVRDGRKIILWTSFICYGATARSSGGYYLCPDGLSQWNNALGIINLYQSSIIGVWLMDEPDSVAYNDRPSTGYDPNLYNALIDYVTNTIHTSSPWMTIALNYGGVEPGLIVPAGLGIVGIESYGGLGDTQQKVNNIEPLTQASLWLLLRAYRDGDMDTSDSDASVDAAAIYEQVVKPDMRITGIYPFRFCIDQDANCGDDAKFYTVGGVQMPLTAQILETIGQEITGK